MGRRDNWRLELAPGRYGPVAVLGGFFVVGGTLGAVFAGMIGGAAAQALADYLRDYLQLAQSGALQRQFWPMLWEQGRFLLAVLILGFTALGVVGIPIVFGARGFLFAFSVAGFCRLFGPPGLVPALFLFGLPALIWGPALFVAGVQGISVSWGLARRMLGDSRAPLPFDSACWLHMALCVGAVVVCAALEFFAVPALLGASARFVL